MSFDALFAEAKKLDFHHDPSLIDWLKRLFQEVIRQDVPEPPNRLELLEKIKQTRGINPTLHTS